jgi:hypothetical protein
MKNLKEKVKARLIKNGNNVNNVNNVNKMMALHFEYASNMYSSVKAISECIRIIY